MKITIDYMGDLMIERGNMMKPQNCPYMSRYNRAVQCGDTCPLFSEPQHKYDMMEVPYTYIVTLEICNGKVLSCKEKDFTDNRNKK